VSDVPLGVFLSGGIDSSAVVAMMREAGDGKILSFSIGYGEKDSSFNELDYAETVARHFGTEHRKFIVEPKIVELLPEVVYHLDEPFADSSSILNYLISREARREITVALTGIGGDEVFGGYPRYHGARLSLGYTRLPYLFRSALAGCSSLVRESVKSRNVGSWIKRFLRGGVVSEEDRYISWMQFFDRAAQWELFSPDFREELMDLDLRETHHRSFDRAPASDYLDRIMYVDLNTYLVDDLLFLGDRMSMANSLEVRVPFCDYRLVEFSASLPFRTRFRGFRLKGLLRKALEGILPDEILHRPKRGFMVPVGRWIREDLKDFIGDALSGNGIGKLPWFNHDRIRTIVDMHFEGRANFAHQIWALLVFKLWHDAYVDGGRG
jgi:asparagine synthase (glutamine-hydrolysing)